jgi:hypothetical protein
MSIQVKQSLNYLIYGAMVELMLDTYSNTNQLTYFDSTLLNKHRNLIPSWKQESKKIFDYLEKSGNIEVIQQYHSLVSVLESVLKSTENMVSFTELLEIINQWEKGEIQIINGHHVHIVDGPMSNG